MSRSILDTSNLIQFWRVRRSQLGRLPTPAESRVWADQLSDTFQCRAIVTPVAIEFLCGARDQQEAAVFGAFLGHFNRIDEGVVLEEDWKAAENKARRVPRSGAARDLGDCLIRAIADRLKCDVLTIDRNFAR
jgi:predicted nucleic acid-binding protein